MPASTYQFLLTGEALRTLLGLRPDERRQLDRLFEHLAEFPFTRGDYQENDVGGHLVEVLLRGNFVVTFRPDHATKELRLIRIERA